MPTFFCNLFISRLLNVGIICTDFQAVTRLSQHRIINSLIINQVNVVIIYC